MSEREVKKCPKCCGTMEIGCLPEAFSWSAGKSLWSIKRLSRNLVHRCKNCGYVELYVEKEE